MKKILIKSCKECPYQQVWMNRECQKIITDVNAISPNCPLADDLPESKLNKQELWNKITCNGMREMTEERFYQALKELPESKGSETEIAKNRMLYFEFDEVKPKVGDRIVKAYLEGDDKLGSIRTIIKDDDNYHMVCGDGSTYNKCAEHGWRRLIEVGYCNNSQQAKSDGWIPVTLKPLYTMDEIGHWECTKDGDGQFLAAIPYADKRSPGETLWWIRHCVVEDEIGLCVVGDDVNEPAGWGLEDITHWQPLPAVPQKKGEK